MQNGNRIVNPNSSRWISMAAGICFLACCISNAQGADLVAGAARIDITPPTGFPMWGYGDRHDAKCVGVLDPLQARALVLELGGQRIAIVSLDLGRAPTRAVSAAIRNRIKAHGIGEMFLVGSHTHHGPVMEMGGWPTAEKPYSLELENKLVQVILDAKRAGRPARLGCGSTMTELNRNRHSKRPDKPVDRELLVMRVEDLQGKPIATAVNFAAHATMTDNKVLAFSADWPGAMAALVEKETGAPCLFLQGAAGDMSANPGGHNGPKAFGEAVAQTALGVAKNVKCQGPSLGDMKIDREDFVFANRVNLGNPLVKRAFVSAFFKDIVDFYEDEYRQGVRPTMSVALLDGRIGIVGVSGEFFSDHAIQLKRRAHLEHLFFLGYCNDYQQYFPTIEAAAEGGYGADAGVSTAEVGAGERMMNRALLQLYKMRGKYPDMQLKTEKQPGKK
jgi:neutral ceramidase